MALSNKLVFHIAEIIIDEVGLDKAQVMVGRIRAEIESNQSVTQSIEALYQEITRRLERQREADRQGRP
jgi:hypothetical protein